MGSIHFIGLKPEKKGKEKRQETHQLASGFAVDLKSDFLSHRLKQINFFNQGWLLPIIATN